VNRSQPTYRQMVVSGEEGGTTPAAARSGDKQVTSSVVFAA